MNPKTARQRGEYITIYSLGFYLAMTTKTWWALLNSIITVFVLWTIFALVRYLMRTYGIGSKEVEKLEAKIKSYGPKS